MCKGMYWMWRLCFSTLQQYGVCVCVCVYLQDTAGDVRGDLGVRCVLCVFTLRGEVVFETRLPQPHQRRAVALDGARLPDGRGDARYANLHHRLVVVIGQIVLSAGRWEAETKHQGDSDE